MSLFTDEELKKARKDMQDRYEAEGKDMMLESLKKAKEKYDREHPPIDKEAMRQQAFIKVARELQEEKEQAIKEGRSRGL